MLCDFVETFYADFKRFLEGDNDCLDTLTRNIDLLCVLIDQEEVQITAIMTMKLCQLLMHQPQPQPLPLRHLSDHLTFLLGESELVSWCVSFFLFLTTSSSGDRMFETPLLF